VIQIRAQDAGEKTSSLPRRRESISVPSCNNACWIPACAGMTMRVFAALK